MRFVHHINRRRIKYEVQIASEECELSSIALGAADWTVHFSPISTADVSVLWAANAHMHVAAAYAAYSFHVPDPSKRIPGNTYVGSAVLLLALGPH